jgi:hypothetical protein
MLLAITLEPSIVVAVVVKVMTVGTCSQQQGGQQG